MVTKSAATTRQATCCWPPAFSRPCVSPCVGGNSRTAARSVGRSARCRARRLDGQLASSTLRRSSRPGPRPRSACARRPRPTTAYSSRAGPPRTGCWAASRAWWSRPAATCLGLVNQRKADVDARVGHLAVALADLAAAQRRAALGPPPDDLVALVEQAAVEEVLQRPPDALDVALVVGDVGLVEMDPEAEPLGELFPLLACSARRFRGTCG